ncbi:MAG: hypothetical protein IT198_10640 [Acidimicrobiia bacterium]|nr:hypothetical protein [Acidimicrobiia bacterium]
MNEATLPLITPDVPDVDTRVSRDFRRMTVSVLVLATVASTMHMIQHRHGRGRIYDLLFAATLAERVWLVTRLVRKPDSGHGPMAVDAATLAAGMIASSRLVEAGGFSGTNPWTHLAGGSSPAYPHLAGPRVGPGAITLLAAATLLAHRLNSPTRDATLRGLSDGMAHVRGYVLSGLVSSTFRRVADALARAAHEAEIQRAAEAAAAERDRMYGVIHDHTLQNLERIAADPDLDTAASRTLAAEELANLTDRLRAGTTGDLQAVADEFDACGLHVTLNLDPEPLGLDATQWAAVLDATREALRNVTKHARTDTATVTTRKHESGCTVTITDRGCGFDPTREVGYGLPHRIRAPLEAVGGVVDVVSSPGRGSTITLTLVIPEQRVV